MILMGEYAVLEGSRAVLMTLKNRLSVTLAAAEVQRITSDRFGEYTGGAKPQHVVLCENVLARFPETPFHIDIRSDIPPTYGFGSSAALVAALVKALCRFYKREENFREMFEAGHAAILDTFGRGSGADLAAALADRPFVVFDPIAKTAAPFAMPFAVQAIYTGYKTPTPEVLRRITAEVREDKWHDIMAKMKSCAASFIAAPSEALVREYQTYMDALGVTCPASRAALDAFSAQGVAAKISGSGRGDCIVGFSARPVAVNVDAPLEFLAQRDLRA